MEISMTQNRKQSRAEPDPKNSLNQPPAKQGAKEDPVARRAFEQERLHPALRLNQEYPEIKPQRYWAGPKDDATAPARPPHPAAMTDLNPEVMPNHATDPAAAWRRTIALLMGFIIIFGFVVLFILVTRPISG
jgi:hypothetical protein